METLVAIAISILTAIFVAALVGLMMICRHKHCRKSDHISSQLRENRPENQLITNMEVDHPTTDLELDDVTPNLDSILNDNNWVDDVSGLAPHCLEILRTCHLLTEKLVGMTMGRNQFPETMTDVVVAAKRISPRVDEVVRATYPPLDPRLLEARCTALVLSVSHLVLIVKNACRLSGVLDWIDQSLADVEDHLKVLRAASEAYEQSNRSGQGSPSNGTSTLSAAPPTTTEPSSPSMSAISSPQHSQQLQQGIYEQNVSPLNIETSPGSVPHSPPQLNSPDIMPLNSITNNNNNNPDVTC
ncbi:unnamed protein product [Owenia fusiformis]|uniref:Transmembrane protein 98 n=1 Tax=Owenia fusiformis TaxID=6347 RepID=A0A8J1TTA9_OWEFU|nr:unnamed protein product [Owenia fusiformis]